MLKRFSSKLEDALGRNDETRRTKTQSDDDDEQQHDAHSWRSTRDGRDTKHDGRRRDTDRRQGAYGDDARRGDLPRAGASDDGGSSGGVRGGWREREARHESKPAGEADDRRDRGRGGDMGRRRSERSDSRDKNKNMRGLGAGDRGRDRREDDENRKSFLNDREGRERDRRRDGGGGKGWKEGSRSGDRDRREGERREDGSRRGDSDGRSRRDRGTNDRSDDDVPGSNGKRQEDLQTHRNVSPDRMDKTDDDDSVKGAAAPAVVTVAAGAGASPLKRAVPSTNGSSIGSEAVAVTVTENAAVAAVVTEKAVAVTVVPAVKESNRKLLSEAELTKLAVAAMKAKLKGDKATHARLIEEVNSW